MTETEGLTFTPPGTLVVPAPAPPPRRVPLLFGATVTALAVLLLGTCAWFLIDLVERNEQQAAQIATQQQAIEHLTEDLLEAATESCPEGFAGRIVWLLVADGAAEDLYRQEAVICEPSLSPQTTP